MFAAEEAILNMGDGALVFALGILFVILVLLLLVLIVKLVGLSLPCIFKSANVVKSKIGKKKKADNESEIMPCTDNGEEDETVAAISAALMAYYDAGAEDKTCIKAPFVIKNIKRIK